MELIFQRYGERLASRYASNVYVHLPDTVESFWKAL